MMHTLVGWHVEMEFQEEGDRTRAAAMVRLSDGTEFRAHGTANRHPSDPDQLRVGEEIMRRTRADGPRLPAAPEGTHGDRRGVGQDLAHHPLTEGPGTGLRAGAFVVRRPLPATRGVRDARAS